MNRVESGDWQTPPELAERALAQLARGGIAPGVVVEPTCGKGAFLSAAARLFPEAGLAGYELDRAYARSARRALEGRGSVEVANFFQVDWRRKLAAFPDPLLVTGNPPWVTNSVLGALDSDNLPAKANFKGLCGLDAITGKSNFDVSEYMILRLLTALQGRRATLAMLCKRAVARRVIEFCARDGLGIQPGGLFRIEATKHFKASVDAVWFVCRTGSSDGGSKWPVYDSLEAETPSSTMAIVREQLVPDALAYDRTEHLRGVCEPEWRSGLKHDCSSVMELKRQRGHWQNGLNERVELEETFVFPLLKSSDVANGRTTPERAVIVPQRALGQDTSAIRDSAPRTWRYLTRHRARLSARKSSIYRGQPDFAIFGVGPYSFAPWKVAVSGLYKRYEPLLVEPCAGRPVMLDDTCYFLPFEDEASARQAHAALRSKAALDFFCARIFWDSKRPISKSILQELNLAALLSRNP